MSDEVIDRQALLDAGLDPDDPEVWAGQYRVRDFLVCVGIWRAGRRGRYQDECGDQGFAPPSERAI